jgi:hypothetical protein
MQNEKYSSEQEILHYYCRSCGFFNSHIMLFNGLSVYLSAENDIVRWKLQQNSLSPPWKRMQEWWYSSTHS